MKYYTIFITLISFFLINNLHSYLSFNNPIDADILLVEGWIGRKYAPNILDEFYRKKYEKIVVIGMSKSIFSENIAKNAQTESELMVKRLYSLADKQIDIALVESKYADRHQTFNYMVCFKNWVVKELPDIDSVNLFSASVPARRSHLILKRVLPSSMEVGVISAPPLSYDAQFWWLSKKGIWVVFKNTVSILYTLLFENCNLLECES
jgi:hypothetical protein